MIYIDSKVLMTKCPHWRQPSSLSRVRTSNAWDLAELKKGQNVTSNVSATTKNVKKQKSKRSYLRRLWLAQNMLEKFTPRKKLEVISTLRNYVKSLKRMIFNRTRLSTNSRTSTSSEDIPHQSEEFYWLVSLLQS